MNHGRILHVFGLLLVASSTSSAQVTRRVSVNSSGGQVNGLSDFSSISSNGAIVAFRSLSSTLVGGDTNGFRDAFCRGRITTQTEIVSVDSSEHLGDGASGPQFASVDGSLIVFSSDANNLVPGDTNGQTDVFVRDRVAGTTQRVSVSSGGAQGDGPSAYGTISADGRYVAFQSSATNLVSGDTNGVGDIFVRDRLGGITVLISRGASFTPSNGWSEAPAISADGNYVVFASGATNLINGDTNGFWDVFRCFTLGGGNERISVVPGTHGSQGNGNSLFPSISADGSCIAFYSLATNLTNVADTNGVADILCRNMSATSIELVSCDAGGTVGNGASGAPSISADGTYVAFESAATNLVPGDTNGIQDIFVRNRVLHTIERVSVDTSGVQGNARSAWPSISGDGRFVAFESDSDNLVGGDTNQNTDIFVRDRDATGFSSMCHPGLDGVQACPCSNPPTTIGRGCNNSSATGGALLTASGAAYLTADRLVFTTFAEKPTAFSIVLQGTTFLANGVVYGQGVRCTGGVLKRLFAKHALAGSVTAPDFGAGDPSISARSAAKGDVISAGEYRVYLVYYRDPVVLGGCSAASTFNATQTGLVVWSP
ncbi:MAG TPA: calcium-binding protein [Planctomycetota bacterium]|jgi:Tol biopolymer transport system component|nr:calcium-binding protein [Planctomycetota bacterium]